MTISKKRDLMTKSTLAYSRVFGNKSATGNLQTSALDEILDQDPIEAETVKRNKLYKALAIAKANNDHVMIQKIELELGVKKPENTEDNPKNSKAMDDLIDILKMKLMDPNISPEEHDKTLRTLTMIMMGKSGNMAAMAYSQPARTPEPKSDPMNELTMTYLKSIIENKSKDEKESDFEKYMKYQNFLNQNTADPMELIKNAKETLAAVGVDISGNQNVQSMQMKLEEMKLTEEFKFKNKELEQKAESNKLMGGLLKELSVAVAGAVADSLDGDDEDEGTPNQKPQNKRTGIKELKVKCFYCKKLTKIDNIDETREIVCEHCSWPHYYDGKSHQVKSITPEQVREALKIEPEEYLNTYETGQLTAQIEGVTNTS